MDKIKKQKMIVILSLIGIVILNLIFSVIKQYETFHFNDWIYTNYGPLSSAPSKIDIKEPSMVTLMVAAIIIFLIWLLFVGLAFKYAKSGSPKVQGRKWPYIVLLISGVVIAILGLFGVTQEGHGTVKLNDTIPESVRDAAYTKLDSSYGSIYTMSILAIIAEVAIAIVCIFALVLISKMKSEKDMQMTNEVVKTGIEQDQLKNQEQNDLP